MAHIVECEDCGKEFDITSTGHEVETERGMIDLCEDCFQKRNRASVVRFDYFGKPYKPVTQADIDRVVAAARLWTTQQEPPPVKRSRPLTRTQAKAVACALAAGAILSMIDVGAPYEDEAAHSEEDGDRIVEALKTLAAEMQRRAAKDPTRS